jgi:formyl-CoA transferase
MHDSSNYPKGEVNYPWQMDSRNKRSLVLDLKQPAARAALDRLIATSDVLVCNFPPPVRDKLRLTYDDVKRVNPRLIYASLTGYGETGPDRDRPGFDVTAYFARSGLLDAQRYEGGPPGVPVPAQGDRATAMTLVSAILMALIHRMKTGEGSWVGTSLLGNGLWSCGVIAQAALVGAYLPHRPPPDRPRSALGTIYRTSDDRWLQLTIVREDKMWPGICETIGRPELLDDPRFATVEERRKRSGELAAILGAAFPAYEHWRKTMAAPASPSASSAGAGRARRRQAAACGAVVDTAIPEMPRTLANRSDWAPSSQSPSRRSARRTASWSWKAPACRATDRKPAGERRYSGRRGKTLPLSGLVVPRRQLVHRSAGGSRRAGRFRRRRDQDEPPGEAITSPQLQEPATPRATEPWQLDRRAEASIAISQNATPAPCSTPDPVAPTSIVNFPPPAHTALKLRWEDIEPINPRLVCCSLPAQQD